MKDPPLTVRVKIGDPVELKCPKHKEGHGDVYSWGYLPNKSPPYTFHSGDSPIDRGFISKDDGTLYFSSITKSEIEYIRNAGGINCMLYLYQIFSRGRNVFLEATDGEFVTYSLFSKRQKKLND